MTRLKAILGYTAAGLTVFAAVLTPLFLMGFFTRQVAATGVKIDPIYTGGEVAREIVRPGYRVRVHRAVHPAAMLRRADSFVQLDWTPAVALPARVSDEIDLDGDGRAELRASFDVPRNAEAALRVDVEPFTAALKPLRGVGKESYTALIARVGEAIVVRVPLVEKAK